MDSQGQRNNPSADFLTGANKQPSVRPKTWQRNQRKFGKQNGVRSGNYGRIEKSKRNSFKDFDISLLGNVPENSIVDQFSDKSYFTRKVPSENVFQKPPQSNRKENLLITNETSFKNVEPLEFSHTFPKPIGYGRKKNSFGSTVNLDNRSLFDFNYRDARDQDACFGILHSKMDPVKRPECAFCKRNNAKDYHHLLKDDLGGVVCPVLSAFTCKMCAATGRNAHTHKYCPVNPITKGDPVAAGMPPGRPLTKADKEWLKYFHTKYLLQILGGSKTIAQTEQNLNYGLF